MEINTDYQKNFLPGKIPPNSGDFYNSKKFAANEMQFLSTMVSMEKEAQERGLQEIKKAINGES
jgi:hypothetical protein